MFQETCVPPKWRPGPDQGR
ncbi:MAG: hypothetical protein ACOC6C_05515 [Verrucomicrobiota bacterium]